MLAMSVVYVPPDSSEQQLRRVYFPGHGSSYLEPLPEEIPPKMNDPPDMTEKSQTPSQADGHATANGDHLKSLHSNSSASTDSNTTPAILDDGPPDYLNSGGSSATGAETPFTPFTPGLSRSGSSSDLDSYADTFIPPVDRLTIFDILENFALPQRLERVQLAIHDNAEKLRRQRAKLASRAVSGKNNLVDKFKKAGVAQPADVQLEKYRRRMRESVDRLNKRWEGAKTVTMGEKISFVSAVLNIFISGYLIGAWPQYFHFWYTAQLA